MAQNEAERIDLQELLGDVLLRKVDGSNARPVSVTELRQKYVGLYFSAHWCPPCRQFTPVLVKAYQELKAAGKPFEIVFVSSDHKMSEFEAYYEEMPWCAVPFDRQGSFVSIAKRFKVQSIPRLVILGPSGEIVCHSARNAVMDDPKATQFPWRNMKDFSPPVQTWQVLLVLLVLWLLWKYLFSAKL